MGEMHGNTQPSVTTRRWKQIKPDKVIAVDDSQNLCRPGKTRVEKNKMVEQIAQLDGAKSLRIQKLEKELDHYRCMLDKMVHQRTERLDRRLAILESCNSSLGENYHKMHQMYLDLLIKTQTYEADIHLSTLEGELSMLGKSAS